MARLWKGAPVAAALSERVAAQVERLKQRGVSPALAIVRVGQRPEDLSYERGALKRCEMVGITVKQFILPDTVELTELLHIVEAINQDAAIHGCLLFRPLPRHLDEAAVCAALAPSKDVDGITAGSLAGVFAGSGSGFPPCTAQACLEILDYYGYELTGKRAVVVGRSLVIGKPAAMLLLQRNATVTLCHTRTADLAAECRRADVLIDVGINLDADGMLVGDVDFAAAEPVADAVTPVPGGVGAVTTSVLARHVAEAAARLHGLGG